jgi:hypothetical protein
MTIAILIGALIGIFAVGAWAGYCLGRDVSEKMLFQALDKVFDKQAKENNSPEE